MRLSEKYRPSALADVVGQPPVRLMKALAANPYPCCVLLEGAPGCGKTTTALALAAELGCVDEFSGLHVVPCSEFSVDRARKLFEGGCGESATLRLRPLEGRGWQVLILEELEWVSPQCQAYLKVVLETKLPSKCIIVATSNGAGKLSSALRQRFRIYRYGSGQLFAQCAQQRLEAIWQAECPGAQRPAGWETWGWSDGEFSMRVALDAMQDQLTLLELAA